MFLLQELQAPSDVVKAHKQQQQNAANRYTKIESTYFPFNNCVWNAAIFPLGDKPEHDGIPMVTLVRQKNFEHVCRASYRFTITMSEPHLSVSSEEIENYFATSGSGQGKAFETRSNIRHAMYSLMTGRKCRVRVELLSGVSISECTLMPLTREKNKAPLYDREKQAWLIESDTSLDWLRFRIYYSDIRNVSRRFVRYVGFGLSVVPRRGNYKPIAAQGVPFSQLHSQKEADVEGFDIKTDISVKEVRTLLLHVVA